MTAYQYAVAAQAFPPTTGAA